MIKVDGIKLNIGFDDNEILEKIAKKLKISSRNIHNFEIVKLSIDARKKPNVFYVANVAVELDNKLEKKFAELSYELNRNVVMYPQKSHSLSPVIVGFGPAGMFAGLTLARMGLRPIVLEQGKCVEEREKDVNDFWLNRKLNKYSNVQFGEGGAGTFSDGKLNTNLSSVLSNRVVNEFYHYGAPKEITYLAKPHIGSDKLKDVVRNIRKDIIDMGGKILFSHKFVGIKHENGVLKSVLCENVETGERNEIMTDRLILALGHSARDTFEMLYGAGVKMEQKPFAMGVRIEQKQEDINIGQYGVGYDKRLPNADYKLVEHLENGRSVFTFCMCPGGEVVASSSNEGEVVTNGMSYFARDKENANSALLVNVTPEDYESNHPLAGVKFQEKYEKLAFKLGGENYSAPCESVGRFLGKNVDKNFVPSYRPSVKFCKIEKCLPDFVSESLKLALPKLNNRLRGFAKDENVLTAIESRSSCPLTIVRDESMQSSIRGVYPIGEGAGYAGGIVSSAVDGIKVAETIYNEI